MWRSIVLSIIVSTTFSPARGQIEGNVGEAPRSPAPEASTRSTPSEVPLPDGVRVLFAPSDNIERELVTLIEKAHVEIVVNQYAITSPVLAKALVSAFVERHIPVAVLL